MIPELLFSLEFRIPAKLLKRQWTFHCQKAGGHFQLYCQYWLICSQPLCTCLLASDLCGGGGRGNYPTQRPKSAYCILAKFHDKYCAWISFDRQQMLSVDEIVFHEFLRRQDKATIFRAKGRLTNLCVVPLGAAYLRPQPPWLTFFSL